MVIKCGTESEKEISFRCVQCGFSVTTLYIQYSPGNIRLMKCGNCKAVADEYIECELMILVIDLILHKIKAYRHLFYNRFSRETLHNEVLLWKLSLGFLILDAYQMLAVCTTQDERSLPASFASFLGLCGKVLMGVFFGNLMFLGIILFGTRKFLNAKIGDSRCKHILLSILVSSYFKIFVIAMMVWEFPSSVVFIIKMFVLSSNALALLVYIIFFLLLNPPHVPKEPIVATQEKRKHFAPIEALYIHPMVDFFLAFDWGFKGLRKDALPEELSSNRYSFSTVGRTSRKKF